MQIPSLDIRPVLPGEQIRDDEVEITEEQAARIELIKERSRLLDEARRLDLAARTGMSRGAQKRAKKGK